MDVQMPDGTIIKDVPEGITQSQLQTMLNKMNATQAERPPLYSPERWGQIAADIPRAGGVAARNVLEGAGNIVDFLSTPIRAGVQMAGGPELGGGGQALANILNLPQPQPGLESVLSEAEKLMAGGGGMLGAAQKMAGAGGLLGQIGTTMAAAPATQLQSMTGAGLAGGAAKELGASPLWQAGASLAGGVAAPLAATGASYLAKTIANTAPVTKVRTWLGGDDFGKKASDIVEKVLTEKGIRTEEMGSLALNQLKGEVQNAMKLGTLDEQALGRLADYRLTGLTPTAGPISLDPSVVTRQENLRRIGAASSNPSLHELANIQNQNAKKIIQQVNALGAGASDDAISAAEKVMRPLSQQLKGKQTEISGLYKAAGETAGRGTEVPMTGLADDFGRILDDYGVENIPGAVMKKMGDFGVTGSTQTKSFTVEEAEKLIKTINAVYDPKNSVQSSALNKLRTAVQDSIDSLVESNTVSKDAATAYALARGTARQWNQIVDKTPALQAIRDGVEPDKFMNTFIIGTGKQASVRSVANLAERIKDNPEAMKSVRSHILNHIKSKALGAGGEEAANVSASGFNSALEAIGRRKLSMFMDKDAVDMLYALGRVAKYETLQPKGSAVNTSNSTATGIASLIDWLMRRPSVQFASRAIKAPIESYQNMAASQNIVNIPQSLQAPLQQQAVGFSPAIPALSLMALQQGQNQ